MPRVRLEARGSDRPWQEAVGMVQVWGIIAEAERADESSKLGAGS